MADVITGVPTDDQALTAVGGGDRELHDEERKRIAGEIQESARAHVAWRSSLPFEQQIALANTPIVNVPPEEDKATGESVSAGGGNGAGV